MARKTVLTLFGTRPEVIKLAPVLRLLEKHSDSIRTMNVASGQHRDLVDPFVSLFGIRVDLDMRLMRPNQDSLGLLHRIVLEMSRTLNQQECDLIVVQGDTTTALAGSLAGQMCGIPVAHVEAGLRSGNRLSPYPEEIHRVEISRLSTLHFAATPRNRNLLLREGIPGNNIFVTGNPVVDAIGLTRREHNAPIPVELAARIGGRKYIVLTTHRRESFGPALRRNLEVLRAFIQEHEDLVLVFPVHPNPNVSAAANEIFAGHPRIILTPPLPYPEFLGLVSECWLVVSDSGGIQEEVPSLGRPLLILRENTERPECVEAGVARLVGGSPNVLKQMLEEACLPGSWVHGVARCLNPYGAGDSASRIVSVLMDFLNGQLNGTYNTEAAGSRKCMQDFALSL